MRLIGLSHVKANGAFRVRVIITPVSGWVVPLSKESQHGECHFCFTKAGQEQNLIKQSVKGSDIKYRCAWIFYCGKKTRRNAGIYYLAVSIRCPKSKR